MFSITVIVELFSIRRHSIGTCSIVIFDGEQQRHIVPDIHVPKHCCRVIGFTDTQSPEDICSNDNSCIEHGSISKT